MIHTRDIKSLDENYGYVIVDNFVVLLVMKRKFNEKGFLLYAVLEMTRKIKEIIHFLLMISTLGLTITLYCY